MPKFLEDKLKKEYGAESSIPYAVMNKLGAMHGSKETAKGAEMQAKHDADQEDPVTTRKRKQRKAAEKVVYGK